MININTLLRMILRKLIDMDNHYYPIGSVITSIDEDFDPNEEYKKQNWERFAQGRTLIGVDETDASFSNVEQTGGEKTHILTTSEAPSHWHAVGQASNSYYLYSSQKSLNGVAGNWSCRMTHASSGWDSTGLTTYRLVTDSQGGGQPHNNLSPYITVYYWKRVG